ncbi:hypothetical protein DPEC_G00111090 [Dallia pectoralis]|uniref:Uncharacterized protein n=1 Tax=Dallia pectoralis TaxID=75939 RepID=A0ACC2GTF0_DALPE|nr:hypothetical protein DPEC_G00111090 [Dallia pectoralis]
MDKRIQNVFGNDIKQHSEDEKPFGCACGARSQGNGVMNGTCSRRPEWGPSPSCLAALTYGTEVRRKKHYLS